MELNDFIKNFASQFEDTDASVFQASTKFKELEEWSSLIALSVLSMIDEEYSLKLTGNDIRSSNTIEDLYNNLKSKA